MSMLFTKTLARPSSAARPATIQFRNLPASNDLVSQLAGPTIWFRNSQASNDFELRNYRARPGTRRREFSQAGRHDCVQTMRRHNTRLSCRVGGDIGELILGSV